MKITTPTVFNYIIESNGGLRQKLHVYETGSWNVTVAVIHTVAHTLTLANIRSINVLIRNDANTQRWDFNADDGSTDVRIYADAANFNLFNNGGHFAGADWDGTGFNRGWIYCWVED